MLMNSASANGFLAFVWFQETCSDAATTAVSSCDNVELHMVETEH